MFPIHIPMISSFSQPILRTSHELEFCPFPKARQAQWDADTWAADLGGLLCVGLMATLAMENGWKWCVYKWPMVGGLVAINLIFPYIGFLIIPIDFHIFQRGGPTTNQI